MTLPPQNTVSARSLPSDISVPVRAAVALMVASQIFEHAEKTKKQSPKALLVRIAADALDTTMPNTAFVNAVAERTAGQSTTRFLLQNLENVIPLEPEYWPTRKVKPSQWGQYSSVMRGLESFLSVDEAPADRQGEAALFEFITPAISFLPEGRAKQWLQQAVAG